MTGAEARLPEPGEPASCELLGSRGGGGWKSIETVGYVGRSWPHKGRGQGVTGETETGDAGEKGFILFMPASFSF